MEMTLNRNFVLKTPYGHSIDFRKDVPTYVPPIAYAEAIAIGAQRVDGYAPDVLAEEEVTKTVVDPGERAALILEAIKGMIEKNDRDDFTASGQPASRAVEREVGFDVDRREIMAAWRQYHEDKAGE